MNSGPTIESLPPELLLHIFSFLEARFIVKIIGEVSRQFKYLVQHDLATWKARYLHRWPRQRFPISLLEKDFDWKEACLEREEQHTLWKDSKTKMQCHLLPEIHFGFVDAVHILKNGPFGVSASRDGSFGIWSFEKLADGYEGDDLVQHHQRGAHEGWVSCVDSFDSKLYTGGWDKVVRGWDLASFSSWEVTRALTAVLCVTHMDTCLCVGTFGHVIVLDTRLPDSSAQKYKYHRRPVLCLAADTKYIISGSEDKSVIVYDRVAGKIFTRIKLKEYPRCFSYDDESLWIGDRGGNLHVLNPAEDITPKVFPSLHKSLITGVIHSYGSLITSSTDRTLRIFEPTWDDQLIPMAVQDTKDESSYLAKYENVLMVASASFSAEVWLPSQVDQYTSFSTSDV